MSSPPGTGGKGTTDDTDEERDNTDEERKKSLSMGEKRTTNRLTRIGWKDENIGEKRLREVGKKYLKVRKDIERRN